MRRIARTVLMALALAAITVGCYPLTSMRWSDSGAVGVVAKADKGQLVDGQTGQTTDLPELAGWVPAVSADGKTVLYATARTFEGVDEAMAALPKAQQALVKEEADRLAAAVLAENAGPGGVGEWPALENARLAKTEVYRNLVIRAVCEKADEQARAALAPTLLETAKALPIRLVQLVAAPVAQPDAGRVLATSLYALSRPRFSPDGRFVAYLCHTIVEGKGDPEFDLWVSPVDGEPKAVRLGGPVAIGYAWRPDSRAVACTAPVGDGGDQKIVGTLNTLDVADAGGTLLAKPAEAGGDADLVASAEVEQRAGVVFNALASAAYLPSGRLLFSSVKGSLPMSLIEGDLHASIFAYDDVTRTLADILPPAVSARMGGQTYFDLSPDGKRVLVPLGKDGFLVYAIGEKEARAPLPEGASPEANAAPPAWKGPDHVACWVNASSSLLAGTDAAKPGSDEDVLVEVDLEGNLVRVLAAP